HAGILHALLARTHRPLNDVFHHGLELCPRQLLYQVLRSAGIRGDEGQIDLCLHGRGKFDLGALGCITQTLQRHLVALAAKVETFVLLEFVNQPVHKLLVDVVAAEVRVTIGGFHLDDAFADLRIEISNVPPPKSYTAMVSSLPLSSPYASAAAVGSLMIRFTSSPAILPASLVACRCASLKYAGTVTTASV